MTRAIHRDVVPRLVALAIAISAALVAFAVAPAASRADACTPPVTNQIACENSKPGSPPSEWEVEKSGDQSIQGYATSMSVNRGDTVKFKIKSETSDYRIDIYRLGYYDNDGARLWKSDLAHTGTGTQPACDSDPDTGLIDCGNWSVSASWAVPSDAVSGVYIAHLVRNDTGGESLIPFVVRDDTSHSDVVLQTSDATWQAYNTYGGNSLYSCTVDCPPGNPSTYKAAYKVSYNRPFHTGDDDGGRSWLLTGAEYPMIRFLERSGYDMSYVSSSDVASRGGLLLNHKAFISSGHDEYWSASQRSNVEAARDAGVNLAFFTGNEVFWKTRWEPSSADGTSTPDRTLVSYKDTHFTAQQDPVAWTGTWRDSRFTTDADGVTPENALTGQSFIVNSGTSSITVPYAYGQMRLWRNTAAASLSPGGSLTLAPSTLGYEWDVDADNGFRPPGEIRLSSTTVSGLELFTDYGSTTSTGGTATHNLTMYRAPSGALVFGSGTVQWAWGLDLENRVGNTPDPNMQQATVNLLADMGAQPSTLFSPLVTTTASSDHSAPTSTLTSPPATVTDGQRVVIRGTAADAGGGVVAGVEVSTDGGTTWHPATSGTTSWTYTWIAHGNPSVTIKTRATDDSGNIETPGPGASVNVTCPCSLWGTNVTPPSTDVDSNDPTPIEVGMKFKADAYGTVSGLRFYKAATNVGTHIGSLWSSTGVRLARATFSNETASGWQTVTFDTPVEVQPGTTYIASYYAPSGHYSATQAYFYRQPAPGPNGGGMVDSPPLHGLRNTGSTTNGVFLYSASSAFPTNTFRAGNYWVDPIYTRIPPPGAVSDVSATEGGRTSANVSWSAPTTGGMVTTYTVTPYVNGVAQTPKVLTGSAPPTSTTVTGLTNGTTYRFTVRASNPNGSGPESAQSNAVTPLVPVAPSAPTGVTAQPASQSVRVDWNVPDSDGDAAITSYTVTPYDGGNAGTSVTVDASQTSSRLDSLSNGTAYTFKVTATNSAGTSPASSATAAVTPQATIFDFASPPVADSGDGNSVEVGTKFTADYDGWITGIRFYKSAANTGPHTGSLWTADGQRLAQVTFTGETGSGWQSATFADRVPVTAGTTYIASYYAPSGHYAAQGSGFTSSVDRGYLHAVGNATSPNGVFSYGLVSSFPTSSYKSSNYWVDVLYAVPAPGQASNVTAAEGGQTSADLSWTAPASGGPVASYVITPYVGSTAQATKTVDGSQTSTSVKGLTTGTTYTFKIQAVNANGSGPMSDASNAVTPSVPVAPSRPTNVTAQPASGSARVTWAVPSSDGDSPITGYTITPFDNGNAQSTVQVDGSTTSKTVSGLTNGHAYTFKVTATNAAGTSPSSSASAAVSPELTLLDFATPSTLDSGDGKAVEVGMKFTSDFTGKVTGIRFYKAGANVGTHTGSLWTADGQRLAQATFANETGSGWQSVTFANPVSITPGTTYVASYFAPKGHYSVTGNGFATAVTNGPLRSIANSASANGIYAYTGTSAFPTSSFNASNYGVDVLFDPAPAPGKVTGVTATAGRQSASVSWTAPASGGPATAYEITPYVNGNAKSPTTVTGSPSAPTSTTISGLTAGTAYTFTVQASNISGKGAVSDPSAPVTPTGAAAPAAPTSVSADPDTKAATVSWNAPNDNGGSPITGYTVTAYDGATAQSQTQVGGSTTSTRVTGLTNGRAYTFTVTATNAAGTSPESNASAATTPLFSLLDLRTPATVDANDSKSTNLGVKFTSDTAGTIRGIRFYKATANAGTHVGTLWSATGQQLAQATFTGESASGWQTVKFSAPVTITAGTTYVASYLAPKGHYSTSAAGFASVLDNPPLHGLANGTSVNGVYAYNAATVFPTSAFNATNYWVDVLFAPSGS